MSAKVWLITGASTGIGLALAEYVLSQGDKVIATVRTINKFPDSLKKAGGHPLVLDLGSSDAVIYKAGEEALKVYGHVDVLVNNAGYGLIAPVEELNLDELRAQFQTNVFGAIALTQALLPSFRARKSGQILNITSVGALDPSPSWGAYCASKAALEAFSESMSREVAPFNIRVLIVEPGFFATNFFQSQTVVDHGKQSAVYTDPSQGYGTLQATPQLQAQLGEIGDPVKLAARVYEVVHGTGLAKGLVGAKSAWLRVPLGTDCGRRMREKIETLEENVKAFEPVWKSTNVEPERLKLFI